MGTDTQISKIESESSIEDLIYQQRSFFLLNPNQLQDWRGFGRQHQYTSERNWVIGSDYQLLEASYEGRLVIGTNMPDVQGSSRDKHIYPSEDVLEIAQMLSGSWAPSHYDFYLEQKRFRVLYNCQSQEYGNKIILVYKFVIRIFFVMLLKSTTILQLSMSFLRTRMTIQMIGRQQVVLI